MEITGIKKSITDALNWIDTNLEDFHPFTKNRSWDVIYGQRMSELAVLVYCLKDKEYFDTYLSKFSNFIISIAQMDRFKDRIFRCPSEFVLYLDMYAVLLKIGIIDKDQKNALEKVISLKIMDAVERTPHRVMDVALSLEMAGFCKDWHKVNNCFDNTILAKNVNPVFVQEDGAYAITHVIFFAYCFGKRKFNFKSKEEYSRIFELFSLLLIDVTLQKHWDLLSEFLICWNCIAFSHTEVYNYCMQLLLSQQNKYGAFPGPERNISHRKNKFKSKAEEELARSSFQHCYHTTLTTTVAFSLHLDLSKQTQKKTSFLTIDLLDEQKAIEKALRRSNIFFKNKLKQILSGESLNYYHLLYASLGYLATSQKNIDNFLWSTIKKIKEREASYKIDEDTFDKNFDYFSLAGVFFSSLNIKFDIFDKYVWHLIQNKSSDVTTSFPISYLVLKKIGLINYEADIENNDERFMQKNKDWEIDMKELLARSYFEFLSGRKTNSDTQVFLEGYALHSVKKYEWRDVFKIINILNYNNRIPKYLIKYMLAQQKPNGEFGYWGLEFSVLSPNLSNYQKEDVILSHTFEFCLVLLNIKRGNLLFQIFKWLGVEEDI